MNKEKTAIVIGAGPGGLAAAMLLAGKGYKVNVFEKQAYLGGRTSQVQLGEYRFDRGPTFLMVPHLLEELFSSVDRRLDHYVKLIELDPLYRLKFGELEFSPSRHSAQTEEQIERLFPGNGQGYRRFMQEEGKKYQRVMPLLQRPFSKLQDYMAKDVFAALPKLNAVGTVYQRLGRYFTDERLKYAFSFQSKYLGMSAWECPGTFTILSYLEHKYGLFHPVGGVNQICQAMAQVIEEYDGHIHLATGVKQVLTKNKKVVGIQLENGERLEADHVVINADFSTAMNTLFAEGELKKFSPAKLAKKKYSCSTFMLYLGVNRSIHMPHHNVLFAQNYEKNVREITTTKILSEDASLYVHNPSALDPTLAPAGKSALYVLLPVPNLTADINWQEKQEQVREAVLTRLEQEPELRGISSAIEEQEILTPLDWQEKQFVYRGATFNLAHSLDQMMTLRPHNRFEELDNCWLVGGGTHPGSGLPTIFESAKISTQLILEQDRSQIQRFKKQKNVVGEEASVWR
ncbi:phytoene desaturase family protein [Bacillus horti]|uniref:Phytoene desaturase n=1 Tax=Caldalkalibacillus horti TaxID=77523 RepID=A0ABT9W224_9BACI|nr:phytoene desaturase family protein [Bacillus horti]MDQ0167301.1 phytoene desaturase [Bacillus horti]